MMSVETANLSKETIIRELWSRGSLEYKLDRIQKELYDKFYNGNDKTNVWLLARRSGKSYLLCILAIEQCIRHPNSIVKFIAPTKIQVDNIIRPLLRQILDDCPTSLRPDQKRSSYTYYFPNGSEIQLAGTDSGHAEKMRGSDSHLFFIDEAGSCDSLEYIIKSILLPTTLITKGRGILASTPPEEVDHDFIKFIEDAEKKGTLIKKTIFDNPRITDDQRNELINELGGLETEAAQRELLCKLIKDPNKSVVPEFNDQLEKEIVKEWPRPPFYDAYVAMDLGGKDLTAVIFGYYDFRARKVIIEDELIMDFRQKGSNLDVLTEKILEIENKLFLNVMTNEVKKPYIRVSDIDYIVLQEIHAKSGGRLSFQIADKYDNDFAINNLRLLIGSKNVIINPKCKTLIRHLRNARWDKSRKKFCRETDDGHYDTVDALKYLLRAIQFNKNPYPAHYGLDPKDLFVPNKQAFESKHNPQIEAFKKLFNFPTKRKY